MTVCKVWLQSRVRVAEHVRSLIVYDFTAVESLSLSEDQMLQEYLSFFHLGLAFFAT